MVVGEPGEADRTLDGVAAVLSSAARRRGTAALLALPLVLLFGIFFVAPFIEMARASFSGSGAGGFAWMWNSPVVGAVAWRTVQLAASVTVLSVLAAYPVAFFIASQPPRRRSALLALVVLPFWTSVLIRTYTWSIVLGREGMLNGALLWLGLADAPQRFLFTPLAVHLGMVQILIPVSILTLTGVMTELDPGLQRAARILGASPLRAFLHVYLPMTRPGVIAACMLTFILSLGFYITPALLGGPRQRTIANLIDVQVHQMNEWGNASAMALSLLVATLAAVGLLRWLVPDRNLHGNAR
jgi:putative spermidine/putrescine transport system permease protein